MVGESKKPFCVKGGECIGNVPTTLTVAKYKDGIYGYCTSLWMKPEETGGYYALMHNQAGIVAYFFGRVLATGNYKVVFGHFTVQDESFIGQLSVGKSVSSGKSDESNVFDAVVFNLESCVGSYKLTKSNAFGLVVGDEVRCKWNHDAEAVGSYLYLYAIPYLELQG